MSDPTDVRFNQSIDVPKGRWDLIRRAATGFVRNVFGSDATVAYTAVYTWLSNQMSHVMMGFFAAALWVQMVRQHGWGHSLPGAIWWILLLPLAKDAIDYAMDVFRRADPFTLNHRELLLDWLTDEAHWWLGMLLAIGFLGFDQTGWWFLGGTLVGYLVLVYAFGLWGWLVQKGLYDASRMPINFIRLIKYTAAQRDERFTEQTLTALAAFQEHARTHTKDHGGGRHFLLRGGRSIHRSELAVSMGCEYVSRWKGAYMISAVKLLEYPERMTDACQMAADLKREVLCLIVDDVNVTLPTPTHVVGPPAPDDTRPAPAPAADAPATNAAAAAAQVQKVLKFAEVFGKLREKYPYVSTVWVMSVGPADDQGRVAVWEKYIRDLLTVVGKSEPTIHTIELRPA